MGEAKRRKQLGLMPEVHAFEAHMDADGAVTFTRVPQDAALRDLIEGALKVSQPYGAAWDSEYRTSYVMAGRPDRFLETAEDVQAIPVPPLRRFSGDLVLGKAATEGTGMSFPVEGAASACASSGILSMASAGTAFRPIPTRAAPWNICCSTRP
ncbi:hypothetical protein ACFSC4_04560 [Deinococcus malanensis]|uniref:hypothetical protein n=1 Tax=Deinococcus malanensis TaxID=1706855 RepID=UPI00362BEC0F